MTVSTLRLLALDTSHLIELIRNKNAASTLRRYEAETFERCLLEQGFVLFLSLHHLAELLSYRGENVVEQSLRYIRTLPVVAWIAPAGTAGVGAITDLMACEVKSALHDPASDVFGVRDRTAPVAIRYGSGEEALAGLDTAPTTHLQEFRRQAERHRSIVAISRTMDFGVSGTRIVDLARRPIRSQVEADQILNRMQTQLTEAVKSRGDKKISDPNVVASDFYRSVRDSAAAFYNTAANPVLTFLKAMGLDPSEITETMTVGNATDIIQFRQHLRIASEIIGISYDTLKTSVRPEQIPSWIIQQGLARHHQKLNRHDGSELADNFLVCLAPYVETCTVDKRTRENVTRAGRFITEFKELTSSVTKAARYTEVLPPRS
jgi:hypothetical protein